MLALFFEMMPKVGHMDHYFRHVAMLKPVLAEHTGLNWLDRFMSTSQDGKILSHQLWEDEASIIRWRENQHHLGSQNAGRNKHFSDYRIRIIEIARHDKDAAAGDVCEVAATGSWVVAGHGQGAALEGGDEQFRSVNRDNGYVTLAAAGSAEEAMHRLDGWLENKNHAWAIAGRIIRDYGMFDRAHAPHP